VGSFEKNEVLFRKVDSDSTMMEQHELLLQRDIEIEGEDGRSIATALMMGDLARLKDSIFLCLRGNDIQLLSVELVVGVQAVDVLGRVAVDEDGAELLEVHGSVVVLVGDLNHQLEFLWGELLAEIR